MVSFYGQLLYPAFRMIFSQPYQLNLTRTQLWFHLLNVRLGIDFLNLQF